jgi:hypothetical protein
MRTSLSIAFAAAFALHTGTAAANPTLTTDKPCYTPGEDITFLVQGINLPDDQRPLRGGGGCQVIASARLRSASGYRYAVVTGDGQQGGAPAHAEIHLTDHGTC